MADRSSELRLSVVVDKKSASALLSQVSGMRTSLINLATQQKSLGLTADGVGKSYQKLSGNVADVRDRLVKNAQVVRDQIAELKRLKSAQDGMGNSPAAPSGGLKLAGRVVSTIGNLSQLTGIDSQITRIGAAASQAAPLLEALGVSETAVAAATPIVGALLIALALAVKTASDAIDAGKKRLDAALDSQKTYYELLATGTTESIKLGIQDLKVKLAVAEAVRRDIQAGQDRIKQIDASRPQSSFVKLANDRAGGTGSLFEGLIGQVTGLTDKAKEADDEIATTQSQLDAYTKALGTNQVALNDAADASAKLSKSLQDSSDRQQTVLQQDLAAQQTLRDQAADQEASILQRAADARVDIARREAQAEADTLLGLQRDQAEGRLRLEQNQADTVLAFQRDEAKSAKTHLANLLKIRKDAEANEFELVLNRDFAGLAKQRRDTDARLAEEDDRYVEERTQRLEALKVQLGDQQKAFIREREQRLRQYQQQLTDLQAAKVRDLKLNDDAARLDIQRLQDKLTAELKIKQQAYAADLALAAEYAARLRAVMSQALIANHSTTGGIQIGSSGATVGGHPNAGGRAAGGPLGAGQTAMVNERRGQRESFQTGGRSLMLPGGAGIFTALRSGRVDPGASGGITITVPIGSVNGSSWADLARHTGDLVENKLLEYTEELFHQ